MLALQGLMCGALLLPCFASMATHCSPLCLPQGSAHLLLAERLINTASAMHQAKRTRLDDETCLDVKSWLAQHPPHTTPNVDVSQPVQLACWTKVSSTAGGGYSFGSTAGACATP